MRTLLWTTVALAAALSLAAPLGMAKADVVVSATEAGCPSPKSFCFMTQTTTVPPGEVVLALTNNGQIPHNICIKSATATLGCAPAGADTDGDGKTVPPDQSATVTFTAPASGTLEYWCNASGHKQAGMSGTFTVQGTTSPPATPPPSPPPADGGTRGSPSLGLVGIALGVGLLALALRRRG